MSCPICGPLAAVEGSLLTHLLRRHPEARATAAIGLFVGPVVLSRRPQQLLWFYAGLLAIAVLLSISDRRFGAG